MNVGSMHSLHAVILIDMVSWRKNVIQLDDKYTIPNKFLFYSEISLCSSLSMLTKNEQHYSPW